MYRSIFRLTLVGLTCLALACGGGNKVDLSELDDDLGMPAAAADYGGLPLSFEANRGQTYEQVEFLSRGNGYALFLTPNEAVLALRDPAALEALVALTAADATLQDEQLAAESESAQVSAPTVLRMRLHGANPDPRAAGLEELPGKSNYLIGNNPEEWHTNVPHYAKVKYQDVYPGIDLVYYGNQGQLEYDFVVAPGADPGVIRLGFEGAEQLDLDEDGNLSVSVPGGTILQSAPVIYQETGEGTRTTIPGRYVVDGAHEVHFDVAPYDASRPLIIDPVLVFSTFLGGSGRDGGLDIAVDADGNAYVTGVTLSDDFPTASADPLKAPLQANRLNGSVEAFVTKINAAGDELVYSTYLGGDFTEVGLAIAVDGADSAYVTGITQSANFPTKIPIQAMHRGTFPRVTAFVAKLDSTGSDLVYSTFLGGSGVLDAGYDIAVDADGNAYVTGETLSSDFNTHSPLQALFLGGGRDAFVTKIKADGSAFVYSTFLGSSAADRGLGIAADADGNAYVTGHTVSASDFTGMDEIGIPHIQPLPRFGTGADAFVTKINPTGSAFVWATFLSGGHNETGRAIAVDAAGNAYVTGGTSSGAPGLNPPFPGTPGSDIEAERSSIQPAYGGGPLGQCCFNFGGDAFVTKIRSDGKKLVYSTYLGGSDFDHGISIAVDAAGNAYVAGFTLSSDFPTVNPTQPAYGGGVGTITSGTAQGDAFVAKISAAGEALVFSTFMGGSAHEGAEGIAVDAAGNVYVTGATLSAGFPTSLDARDTTLGGTEDAFVVKLAFATAEQVAIVAADIEDLVAEGTLSGGQAAALMATLDTGLRMLTDRPTGNDIAGMNLLLALVNQVQGLIEAGILTPEEGQPLINVANAIIDDFLAG